MRKRTLKTMTFLVAGLMSFAAFTACSDDNSTTNNDNRDYTENGGLKAYTDILFSNNTIGNGDDEVVFTGKQTLAKGTYTLKGWVYVADGAELTIEPGTVIKGDKASKASLIVERGGKLIAKGTKDEPIVFTSAQAAGSRRPGDWGGLIICGKAPNNAKNDIQIEGGPRTKHGGTDAHDNSGVLSYVRVEFAGYPFQKDKEINGVTLGSVGDGTQIDHVQVSYSNDDSFEWFGGTVNCKNLIAFRGWDDDFDTDNGFSGSVQYGLVVRDSKIADTSKSNGFESDNDATGSTSEPFTSAVFSNVTFVGPWGTDANFVNDANYIDGNGMNPNNGAALGQFQAVMQIRRGSRLNCINTIAYGYPIGIMLDAQKGDTQEQATAGNIKLQNIWFADMKALGSDANGIYADKEVTYNADRKASVDSTSTESFSSRFFKAQTGNKVFTDITSWGLTALTALPNVSVFPTPTSSLLNAASFAAFSSNSWFDTVSFIGAFGTEDWTAGWANFDPQNTAY